MSLRKEISEIKLLIEGMLSTDAIPTPFIDLLLVKVEELKKELLIEKKRLNGDSETVSEQLIESKVEDVAIKQNTATQTTPVIEKLSPNPFNANDNKKQVKTEWESINNTEQKERVAEVLEFTDNVELNQEPDMDFVIDNTDTEPTNTNEELIEDITTEKEIEAKIKTEKEPEKITNNISEDAWKPIKIEETVQLIYGPHPRAFAKEEQENKITNQNISDKYRTNRKVSDLVLGKERLGEQMEQKPISDLRRAIPLVDRFRFQRELFKNNGDLYRSTIDKLNTLSCYEDAEAHLIGKINIKSDSAEEFLSIVKRRWV